MSLDQNSTYSKRTSFESSILADRKGFGSRKWSRG